MKRDQQWLKMIGLQEIKAIVLRGKPTMARYYALVSTVQQTSNPARFPLGTNYRLEPESEFEFPGPDVPVGIYRVFYYHSEKPHYPIFQSIEPFINLTNRLTASSIPPSPANEAQPLAQKQPGDRTAPASEEIPPEDQHHASTLSALLSERAQDATDFIKHRLGLQIQQDANYLARQSFYTKEIKELLETNQAHRAELSRLVTQQQLHNAEYQRQIGLLSSNLVTVAEHLTKTIEASFSRMSRWKDPPPPPPAPPPPPDYMSGLNTLTMAARDVLVNFINRHKPGAAGAVSPQPPIANALMADAQPAPQNREDSELLGVLTSLLGQTGKTPGSRPSDSAAPPPAGGAAAAAGSEIDAIREFILKHFKSKEELDIVLDQLTPELPKK